MAQISKRKRGRQSACLDVPAASVFFKALCDPNRLAILSRLAQCTKPRTVTQISECCPTDFSVVSRHLGVLRDAGIVSAERRGKEVHYVVRFKAIVSMLRGMADAIESCCPNNPLCRPSRKETCR